MDQREITMTNRADVMQLCCIFKQITSEAGLDQRDDSLSVVEFLLECGAAMNKVDKAGATPLLDAVQSQETKIIKFLASRM